MPKNFKLIAVLLLTCGVVEALIGALKPKLSVGFMMASPTEQPKSANEERRGLQAFLNAHPESIKYWDLSEVSSRGDLSETLRSLERVKRSGTKVLVGYTRNEDAIAASRFAEANGLLYLSPSVTDGRVSAHKKNTYQVSYSDSLQGAALARFASQDLKRKRILVLKNTSSLYSLAINQSFEGVLRLGKTQAQTQILSHVYSLGEPRLEELQKSLRQFKPDMIFIADKLVDAQILVKFIYEHDPMLAYLAGDTLGSKADIQNMLGKYLKIRLYYASPWHANLPSQENQKFKEAYQRLFPNSQPSGVAALTYDSLVILLQALRQLETENRRDRDLVAGLREVLKAHPFFVTTGQLSYQGLKQHTPIKDVLILVTDAKRHRFVRGMRTVWPISR